MELTEAQSLLARSVRLLKLQEAQVELSSKDPQQRHIPEPERSRVVSMLRREREALAWLDEHLPAWVWLTYAHMDGYEIVRLLTPHVEWAKKGMGG